MNKYEIMFIVKTDIEEGTINQIADNLKKVLTDKNAAEKLLSSPEAKELLKNLLKG